MKIREIKDSIFFKLISFFIIVLAISFVAILIYSNQYIDQKAKNTLETESIKALNTMNNYVSEKYNTAKRMIASLYNNKYYNCIPALMDTADLSTYEKQKLSNAITDFLQFHFSSDKDITNIALEDYQSSSLYLLKKEALKKYNQKVKLQAQLDSYKDYLHDYGITVFPVYESELSPYNGYLIPMVCNIKSMNMVENIGCLFVDFTFRSMNDSLDNFYEDFPSIRTYILSSDSTIIYSLDNSEFGTKFSDFSVIPDSGGHYITLNGKNCYVDIDYNHNLNLFFLVVQPMKEIYQSLIPQKTKIYLGIFALILISAISTTLFGKKYFNRIHTICHTIKQIQSGNLKIRLNKPNSNDELSIIAENLNNMCCMLEDYINKVYVSQINEQSSELLRKDAELKQKVAELYALQTQINPHFLYNTLEAIRMKSLSCGNRDAAQMTYLLSNLFRQSLKTDFVTSISEELETCQVYLDLTQYRFPGNLNVKFDVDDDICEYGIIRHVLQPLIENTVVHGFSTENSNNEICIKIIGDDSNITLSVIDNGKGISGDQLQMLKMQLDSSSSSESKSIGLQNVHQRITRIFGFPYGVSLDSKQGLLTIVTITIPRMTLKEMKKHVQCFSS